jgi:hypothetical protein
MPDAKAGRPVPYNAIVIGREEVNPQLLIPRGQPDGPLFEFKPGQFAVLGLLGREPRVPEAAPEEPPSAARPSVTCTRRNTGKSRPGEPGGNTRLRRRTR